jgi:hypothetical protein
MKIHEKKCDGFIARVGTVAVFLRVLFIFVRGERLLAGVGSRVDAGGTVAVCAAGMLAPE